MTSGQHHEGVREPEVSWLVLLAKLGTRPAIPLPPRGTDGSLISSALPLLAPWAGPSWESREGAQSPRFNSLFPSFSGFTGPGFGPMERGSVVCTPSVGGPV